jgi:hypothetical protein
MSLPQKSQKRQKSQKTKEKKKQKGVTSLFAAVLSTFLSYFTFQESPPPPTPTLTHPQKKLTAFLAPTTNQAQNSII